MLLQLETNQFNFINYMNGGLDKVSYIIKRQGLSLVIIIVHFKSAGMKSLL